MNGGSSVEVMNGSQRKGFPAVRQTIPMSGGWVPLPIRLALEVAEGHLR